MTQSEMILAHLKSGKPITPLEALKAYGVYRLGARIWDLKRQGHPIRLELVSDRKTKKHYASYRLAGRG